MSRWADARRVLCVRLDSLGDVLMTTPALHALRQSVPSRRLTLLTSPSGAALAPLLPDVDDVIVYEPPWMKASGDRPGASDDLATIDRLRDGGFDAAVIFTVFSQSPLPAALLCHLAGVPLRVAYCRENPYRLLTDWLPDPDALAGAEIRHEVRRQLDLAAAVGATTDDERLQLRFPPAAARAVRSALAGAGIDPDARTGWAVLHPGATAPSRRYPTESHAAVATALVRDHGWTVVLAGGAAERDVVDEIQRAAPVPTVSMVGSLDLGGLAALISLAPVLIANNSGPAHIAAAVGTPVVDLYALTNPQHTPWMVPARVLSQDVPCRNCFRSECPMGHHLCLRGVPPSAVVEAAVELAPRAAPPRVGSQVPVGARA
jgi:lipopolysaccharide heptosyltransferase II